MIGRETRVLLRHYLEPPEESVQRFETPPGTRPRWTSRSSGCRGASGTR